MLQLIGEAGDEWREPGGSARQKQNDTLLRLLAVVSLCSLLPLRSLCASCSQRCEATAIEQWRGSEEGQEQVRPAAWRSMRAGGFVTQRPSSPESRGEDERGEG